jgi:hypothetical protein
MNKQLFKNVAASRTEVIDWAWRVGFFFAVTGWLAAVVSSL